MPERSPAEADPFTGVLIGFARELRSAGIKVGTGDVLTYFRSMTPLDPTDLVDLYWAGKAALLSRHEDMAAYDRFYRRLIDAVDLLDVNASFSMEVIKSTMELPLNRE